MFIQEHSHSHQKCYKVWGRMSERLLKRVEGMQGLTLAESFSRSLPPPAPPHPVFFWRRLPRCHHPTPTRTRTHTCTHAFNQMSNWGYLVLTILPRELCSHAGCCSINTPALSVPLVRAGQGFSCCLTWVPRGTECPNIFLLLLAFSPLLG